MRQVRLATVVFGSAMLVGPGVACAESSVTLYGLIDTGINYVNNAQTAAKGAPNGRVGSPQYSQSSSIMQANRWGLRVTEDLGGGYSVLSVLESGVDNTTGKLMQEGTFFGRQAYVGVDSPYGRVTLGRQYDIGIDFLSPMHGDAGAGSFAAHAFDIDDLGLTFRVNNAVKYTSPNLGGLTVGLLYGFGNVAGNFSRNSIYSVGALYSNGPWKIGATLLDARNPNQSFWGNMQLSSPTGNNLGPITGVQVDPIYGGFASAGTYRVIATAGEYSGSQFTVGLTYSNVSFRDLNDPASGTLSQTNPLGYTGTAVFNSYSAYARSFVRSDLQIVVAYNYVAGGGVGGKPGAKYNQFNASVDYFLSKRTDVYVLAGYQIASGIDSTGQPAVASLLGVTPSNSSRQLALRIGIRHKF